MAIPHHPAAPSILSDKEGQDWLVGHFTLDLLLLWSEVRLIEPIKYLRGSSRQIRVERAGVTSDRRFAALDLKPFDLSEHVRRTSKLWTPEDDQMLLELKAVARRTP
jgi:hypothetical protein